MKHFVFAYIFFLMCQLTDLTANDQVIALSQQASALAGAHDYTQASALYEQLAQFTLPTWQNARIQYNLGTLKLAQKQATEALKIFKTIQPFDLSLPRFAQNLFLNEGIAYFTQAQSSSHLPEQQLFFIEQSLQALKEAQALNCQEISLKQACIPHPLVEYWLQTAHLQLEQTRQQQRQQWIKQTSAENLANVLFDNLKKWLHIAQSLQTNLNPSPLPYLEQQIQLLIPLWDALKQKESSSKETIEQAFLSYSEISKTLKKQEMVSAIKNAQASLDALLALAFSPSSLQQIALNYQILLLQDTLTFSKLNALRTDLETLKLDDSLAKHLPEIQKNLQTSLTYLKAKQEYAARFFLLASFSQFQFVWNTTKKEKTPVLILQQALEQAHYALQLSFLSILIPKDFKDQTALQKVLQNQQQNVLQEVKPFLKAVLTEQKAHFQEAKCQRFPWEQVIPLFDKGYQAAQEADKELKHTPVRRQVLITYQQQTMQDWQKALDLLQHPLDQQNQQTNTLTSPALNETFRLVQEMYLEDQAQPAKEIQELHAW